MKKTGAAPTESFEITLSLQYSGGQREYLDGTFADANRLYHRLVGRGKARLVALEHSDGGGSCRQALPH